MEFRSPTVFAMNLDFIKNISVKDFEHFVNRRGFELRQDDPSLFHKMLFNAEGQNWKDLRSEISPAFSAAKIKHLFEITTESSKSMISFAQTQLSKHENEIELGDICFRFTMDVIASAAFGIESSNFVDKDSKFAVMATRFARQFDGFGGLKLLLAVWAPALFRCLRLSLLDEDMVGFFSGVVKSTIEHRKESGRRRTDFLQLLLDARDGRLKNEDEDDGDDFDNVARLRNYKASSVEFTDELILAQSLMFYLAGFSTGSLMQFALYEIAVNPEVQDRLANAVEIAAAGEDGLSYDAINSIEYLDMVISETLRMYPASPRIERRCLKKYKVPGCPPLDKGMIIAIPIMQIHHDPDYYPEPEKFIPERFSAENKAGRNPTCYIPFGLGPRSCVARRFAITETKCAIAHLIHNFKLAPSTKTQIPMEIKWNLTLKPKDGLWLKLTPRNSQT